MPARDFARQSNVDPNSLLKILRGQASITLDIAERLVKALTGPDAVRQW
ncbi:MULTISPECIES: helix-turn-helix domain-containing protein [Parasutterella]